MKRECIKTYNHTEPLWVGMGNMNLCSSVYVYKYIHKFLWFTWNTYEIKTNIPYIEEPFYDGEFATNNRLGCIEKMLYSQATDYLNTIQK